jgi:hypothetical protein
MFLFDNIKQPIHLPTQISAEIKASLGYVKRLFFLLVTGRTFTMLNTALV